jgi:hypothetical protein
VPRSPVWRMSIRGHRCDVPQPSGVRLDWEGWCAIDAAERERGRPAGRPRVKFVDRADMLTAAEKSGRTNESLMQRS